MRVESNTLEPGSIQVAMSALGHWRTLGPSIGMSALPPKADIRRRGCNVR